MIIMLKKNKQTKDKGKKQHHDPQRHTHIHTYIHILTRKQISTIQD